MSKTVRNEPTTLLEQDKVDISEIFVDPAKNMRRFAPSAKDVESLAVDIKDKGQLQAVVVRPMPPDNANGFKYELVAGYNRYAAIESLISTGHDMQVLVRVIDAEDMGAMLANISENMKRNSVSIIDLSYAIGKLKDGDGVKDAEGNVTVTREAMTLKDIATHLGMSHGNVSEIDKMRLLRSPIQKKIHNGEITKDLARQLIRMTEEEQDVVLAKLEAGETSSVMVQAVKGKKGGKKRKAKAGSEGEAKEKRPLSAKAALLIMEELAAKPETAAVEEGEEESEEEEESEGQVKAREIFKQFKRFLEGKIGAKGLLKNIVEQLG